MKLKFPLQKVFKNNIAQFCFIGLLTLVYLTMIVASFFTSFNWQASIINQTKLKPSELRDFTLNETVTQGKSLSEIEDALQVEIQNQQARYTAISRLISRQKGDTLSETSFIVRNKGEEKTAKDFENEVLEELDPKGSISDQRSAARLDLLEKKQSETESKILSLKALGKTIHFQSVDNLKLYYVVCPILGLFVLFYGVFVASKQSDKKRRGYKCNLVGSLALIFLFTIVFVRFLFLSQGNEGLLGNAFWVFTFMNLAAAVLLTLYTIYMVQNEGALALSLNPATKDTDTVDSAQLSSDASDLSKDAQIIESTESFEDEMDKNPKAVLDNKISEVKEALSDEKKAVDSPSVKSLDFNQISKNFDEDTFQMQDRSKMSLEDKVAILKNLNFDMSDFEEEDFEESDFDASDLEDHPDVSINVSFSPDMEELLKSTPLDFDLSKANFSEKMKSMGKKKKKNKDKKRSIFDQPEAMALLEAEREIGEINASIDTMQDMIRNLEETLDSNKD